jgi:TolB-like protein/Tfp pilus assembly protein PilF
MIKPFPRRNGLFRYSGRWEESAFNAEKALRLNPFPGAAYYFNLGRAYFMTGQYDKSIAVWEKLLQVSPNFLYAHIFLSACYSSLGSEVEASAAANEVLRINPKFTIESHAKRLVYKNKADIEREVTALRRAGLPEHPPFKLPDKPSIAVLPFDNMSDDPKQEYFSDGITENIIMALSKTPKLFVIARNSTFVYKDKPVNIKRVSEELGVRYILEGSVQKTEKRVRITAQLIDTTTGNHQWAERYERELKDIFALQDEITLEIITALQVELTEGEQSRILRGRTTNLEAFLKILKGREHHFRFTKEDIEIAKRMYKEAITIDPIYATAYYWLAIAIDTELLQGWSKSRKKDIERLFELSEKIFSLDGSSGQAHIVLSRFYAFSGELDRAITEAKKAVDLDPNDAEAYAYGGHTLCMAQRYKEGKEWFKKAIRLNPSPPDWYLFWLGASYMGMESYEEAIATFKKTIKIAPTVGNFMFCAIALSEVGRHEEAIEMANKSMNLLHQDSQRRQNTQLSHLAEYYRRAGRFEEAIATSRKLLDNNPKTEYELRAYITLTCTYSALGKEEDARTAAAEILRIMPDFSVEAFVEKYLWRGMTFNDWFLKHESDKDLLMNALHRAGLK